MRKLTPAPPERKTSSGDKTSRPLFGLRLTKSEKRLSRKIGSGAKKARRKAKNDARRAIKKEGADRRADINKVKKENAFLGKAGDAIIKEFKTKRNDQSDKFKETVKKKKKEKLNEIKNKRQTNSSLFNQYGTDASKARSFSLAYKDGGELTHMTVGEDFKNAPNTLVRVFNSVLKDIADKLEQNRKAAGGSTPANKRAITALNKSRKVIQDIKNKQKDSKKTIALSPEVQRLIKRHVPKKTLQGLTGDQYRLDEAQAKTKSTPKPKTEPKSKAKTANPRSEIAGSGGKTKPVKPPYTSGSGGGKTTTRASKIKKPETKPKTKTEAKTTNPRSEIAGSGGNTTKGNTKMTKAAARKLALTKNPNAKTFTHNGVEYNIQTKRGQFVRAKQARNTVGGKRGEGQTKASMLEGTWMAELGRHTQEKYPKKEKKPTPKTTEGAGTKPVVKSKTGSRLTQKQKKYLSGQLTKPKTKPKTEDLHSSIRALTQGAANNTTVGPYKREADKQAAEKRKPTRSDAGPTTDVGKLPKEAGATSGTTTKDKNIAKRIADALGISDDKFLGMEVEESAEKALSKRQKELDKLGMRGGGRVKSKGVKRYSMNRGGRVAPMRKPSRV